MQGLLLKPQFPSPGVVWGRKEGLGRALASSEALLDIQGVLCEHEKPVPKKDQDTRASARGSLTHDRDTMQHHLRSTARGAGQYLEGWEQQARKWMWMVLGGHPAQPHPLV